MKQVTSVIPRFRLISTEEFNFNIIWMIQCYFQGWKVSLKIKMVKNDLKQIQVGTIVIRHFCVILTGE